MAKGDIHTVPHGDGWANRSEENTRVTRTYDTKRKAQADGRQMAIERGVAHMIHNLDGEIAARHTYSRARETRDNKG